MKLRYTSLQVDAGAAEEDHPDLPTDLGGHAGRGVQPAQPGAGVVAAVARHLRPAARASPT